MSRSGVRFSSRAPVVAVGSAGRGFQNAKGLARGGPVPLWVREPGWDGRGTGRPPPSQQAAHAPPPVFPRTPHPVPAEGQGHTRPGGPESRRGLRGKPPPKNRTGDLGRSLPGRKLRSSRKQRRRRGAPTKSKRPRGGPVKIAGKYPPHRPRGEKNGKGKPPPGGDHTLGAPSRREKSTRPRFGWGRAWGEKFWRSVRRREDPADGVAATDHPNGGPNPNNNPKNNKPQKSLRVVTAPPLFLGHLQQTPPRRGRTDRGGGDLPWGGGHFQWNPPSSLS